MDLTLLVGLLAPCLLGLTSLGKTVAETRATKAAEKAGEALEKTVGEPSAVQAGKI